MTTTHGYRAASAMPRSECASARPAAGLVLVATLADLDAPHFQYHVQGTLHVYQVQEGS